MSLLPTSRAYSVYVALGAIALGIIWRAYVVQLRDADMVLERAGWMMEETISLNVPRGAIRDRFGVPFAESVEAYNVIFDPRAFYISNSGKENEMAEVLRLFPGFNVDEFVGYADLPVDEIPRYKVVARNAPPPVADSLKAAIERLRASNSFRFEQVFRRYYPLGPLAGGLIGFVDRDGVEGRSGVERGMNEALHAEPVRYRVTRDVSRAAYLLGDVPDVRSARGKDVELTIDSRLQRATEEALMRALDKHRAKEAMAVVSNVQTGELLAVASVPTIDPNRPFDFEESLIWSSHAVGHAHEPGSTAKILTFAAAIDSNAIRYDSMVDCENGSTIVSGRRINDTVRAGVIPAWKALQISSNVCAWKMAQLIGAERHREYLVAFGLGKAPSIPVNGLTIGRLPALRWIDSQHANIAFGYAFSASILQMHMAIAGIANEGIRMEPMIVRATVHGDGTREEFEPVSAGPVVKPSTSRAVLNAMEQIVHGEEGATGWRAIIPGVRVAAKTGTARTLDPETGRYQNRYLASFTGVFPADAPKYAISVWVVHPDNATGYYGGEVAAPVFKEIGTEVMRLYGPPESTWPISVASAASAIPEDVLESPSSEHVPEIAFSEGAALMPNLVGLRARTAIEWLREGDLEVAVFGSGIVAGHQPSAGARIEQGGRVILQLAETSEQQ